MSKPVHAAKKHTFVSAETPAHAEREATFTQLYSLHASQLTILMKQVNCKAPINANKLEQVEALMHALGYRKPSEPTRVSAKPTPAPKKEVTPNDIARLHELITEEVMLLRNTADSIAALAHVYADNPRNLTQQVTSELRYCHTKSNLPSLAQLEVALDPHNPYRS